MEKPDRQREALALTNSDLRHDNERGTYVAHVYLRNPAAATATGMNAATAALTVPAFNRS